MVKEAAARIDTATAKSLAIGCAGEMIGSGMLIISSYFGQPRSIASRSGQRQRASTAKAQVAVSLPPSLKQFQNEAPRKFHWPCRRRRSTRARDLYWPYGSCDLSLRKVPAAFCPTSRLMAIRASSDNSSAATRSFLAAFVTRMSSSSFA